MKKYTELSAGELQIEKELVLRQYNEFKAKNLSLDMSRGKPCAEQLDLVSPMLDAVSSDLPLITQDGIDIRNYGVLDGLPEAKRLFAELLEVRPEQVIVGGNSSLALIYDAVSRAMQFGTTDRQPPWNKLDRVKFLCPSPGYDRHFTICEFFGIEMITISMNENGPDMDTVERLVSSDPAVKGIWCIPKYSNPTGITYSDDVVRRFAALRPAAEDFRIFWDNAYCVHDLDRPATLLNLMDECIKQGNEDMPFIFASTSKITFSGAGLGLMAASDNNLERIRRQYSVQTIGFNKLNHLMHTRYLKNLDGIKQLMQGHKKILAPKFRAVLDRLDRELAPLGIAEYTRPGGGYFISLNTHPGCAKRTVELCKEAGVTLTPAGAAFPYGNDPSDSNIRLAPTYPPINELESAMELFCICVRLATIVS